jgi:DNA-binding CsgD family transcriptional regulator
MKSMKNPKSDEDSLNSPLLEQMPGWMFIKNIELKYTSTTLRSAHLCGFKNQHDKYGQSDYELKCKAAESAETFQEQDKKVISTGHEMSFLQLNQYADNQIHIFLTKKKPITNSCGDIIGVCGIVEEISNPSVGQAIFKLVNLGKMDYIKNSSKKNFQIDANELFNQLSPQESELIFYFIRGFTSKEIGLFMKLSPRSVDFDLEMIQNKFNCHSRNDFVIFCLTHGFSNVIPQIFIQRCLNKIITVQTKADKRKMANLLNKQLAMDSLAKITQFGLLDSSIISSGFSQNTISIDHFKLSKRQKECLEYLIEGYTTKIIANKLGLSSRTVEHYLDSVRNKLGCRSRLDLIKMATHGFTSP